jgi:hypothetical protein
VRSVNVPRGTTLTLERITLDANGEVSSRAVWIELHSPTHAKTAGVPPAGRRREPRIRPQAARLALMRSASAGFRFRRAIFKS